MENITEEDKSAKAIKIRPAIKKFICQLLIILQPNHTSSSMQIRLKEIIFV